MDAIITHMERLPVNLYYRKAVVPLVNWKVCRVKLAEASDRIRGSKFTVHVALGVFTRLVIVSLHRRDLAP